MEMPRTEENRSTALYLARVAEQAERYTDMAMYMRFVVQCNPNLSVEERNLFSVAYKNVVGALRPSWRIVSSIEQRAEQNRETPNRLLAIQAYRRKIEEQLLSIIVEILDLVNMILQGATYTPEFFLFMYKMKGDYERYAAEFTLGEERKRFSECSLQSYSMASDTARELPPTHPIRLGLGLSFSVFYYEILNSPERACRLAKETFDAAIADLDNLSEAEYKDATIIMQLLRDNLTLWTNDMDDGKFTKLA